MRPAREDIADLTQRAGRADGWRDFVGMLNPSMAVKLQTGEMHLPDLDPSRKSEEQTSPRALMPIILGRMLRRSYPMKVQNWYISGSKHSKKDQLESLFEHTSDQEMIVLGASDDDPNVRCGVAANHVTPIPVLNALTFDSDFLVRLAIVANARTPVSDLEYLAFDQDSRVKNAALQKLSRIMGEVWVQTKFQI